MRAVRDAARRFGEVLNQTLGYARDANLGVLVRNLGRNARDNPLPLALMGIGIVWLLVPKGRRSDPLPISGYRTAFDEPRNSASDMASGAVVRTHRMASDLGTLGHGVHSRLWRECQEPR